MRVPVHLISKGSCIQRMGSDQHQASVLHCCHHTDSCAPAPGGMPAPTQVQVRQVPGLHRPPLPHTMQEHHVVQLPLQGAPGQRPGLLLAVAQIAGLAAADVSTAVRAAVYSSRGAAAGHPAAGNQQAVSAAEVAGVT